MRNRIFLIATLLIIASWGAAQDSGAKESSGESTGGADRRRLLQTLQLQQKDAVARLEQLLDSADALVKDLRLRGEEKKAELLRKAVAILNSEQIELSTVSGAGAEGDRLLGDLKSAMDRMHRLLNEETDRTEEVQELGKHVIATLARVIETLGKADNLDSYDKRVKDLGDAQRDARELSVKQDQLRKKTRDAVERSKAERTAEKAVRELETLKAMLQDIDMKSREDLADVEKSRELVARVQGMLEQQKQLHRETEGRSGDPTKSGEQLTPRVNQALAELEAISRAARKAQQRAANNQATAEMADHLDKLAKMQEALASKLERSDTGKDVADEQRKIRQALQSAQGKAPADAQDELRTADAQAGKAEQQIADGKWAAESARSAATAARKAADLVKAAVAKQQKGTAAAAKRQEENAERARKLAKELDALAQSDEAKGAGLSAELNKAKDAVERAAGELDKAGEAEGRGRNRRAREEAKSAADRTEKAQQNLRDRAEARGDLSERQSKVASEMQTLAERNNDKQLEQAATAANKAKASLRDGELPKAAAQQKAAIAALQQALANAQKRAQGAAQKNASNLKAVQEATRKAAEKAGEVGKQLEQGAKQAKENDSRRRMEDATDRVRQAEREIRNSLKKLRDAQPRAAEQDRREASDKIDGAMGDLSGLRETHEVKDEATKEKLKEIAKEQRELETQVRRLDEQLKRLKEKRGANQVQDAQSAMRDASKQLEDGDSDEAERSQERAQKSLDEAKKELEGEQRRYRNLRQYELLFKLREELKRFRRESQTHRESLQKIAAMVKKAGRVTRHINRSELKKLRSKIDSLQRNVAEKAEAIEKENAVVYSYLLKGCAADLDEVTTLLADKDVGVIPRELLGDVVRRFELALRGLERELDERKKEDQQQNQGEQGKQGENQGDGPRPLVPPEAEIRMILVMQRTLNAERKDFFENRPELDDRELSDREKSRLKRFYHRQGSLAELFDTLRQNLLGNSPSGIEMPESEGEEE